MFTDRQILKRPYVTEKSTRLKEQNSYVLEVDTSATKGDIKLAVEARFKVDVLSVRTIKIHGKFRRRVGPTGGYQSDRKKAIVKLKTGQQLNWEEKV
jgi:large subunit ribosomal protein L23